MTKYIIKSSAYDKQKVSFFERSRSCVQKSARMVFRENASTLRSRVDGHSAFDNPFIELLYCIGPKYTAPR